VLSLQELPNKDNNTVPY